MMLSITVQSFGINFLRISITLLIVFTYATAIVIPHVKHHHDVDETTISIPYPKIFQENYKSDMDFLAIGDWGSSGSGKDLVATAMKTWAENNNTLFVINVGDNFYQSNSSDYDGVLSIRDSRWKSGWLDPYRGRLAEIPWYTVAGNHDWYTNITAQIDYYWKVDQRFFFPSLYYVRVSKFGKMKTKVAWIHIDTDPFAYNYSSLDNRNSMKENLGNTRLNTTKELQEKLDWMEEQLKRVQDAKWIFVVGHHTLVGECRDQYYLPKLSPLFERYRVTAYFAGHSHTLGFEAANSTSPVTYFTTGAASKHDSEGCMGSWSAPNGTMGFLHVRIHDDEDKMYYEFINAATADLSPEIIYQGSLNVRKRHGGMT
ncbi:10088_t:CDS:2 [Acaulospora morrowiae]|uniref:10088_t:CDS:1 n=1 Tax=Acaulospora morrowiae TaxID=94023 RepID=A0A9N8WTQ8_9GLOM|nr:10088_t:CDS:2 [Acaulospora morrowiae]